MAMVRRSGTVDRDSTLFLTLSIMSPNHTILRSRILVITVVQISSIRLKYFHLCNHRVGFFSSTPVLVSLRLFVCFRFYTLRIMIAKMVL